MLDFRVISTPTSHVFAHVIPDPLHDVGCGKTGSRGRIHVDALWSVRSEQDGMTPLQFAEAADPMALP